MSSVVAVVKSVIGQVLAVSAEEQRRVLVEGDRLFLGDLVQTGDAGAVALQLPDGRVLDLGRDSQLSASELAPHAPAQPAVTASTEELQKAIAAGADPTQTLAPTAAGPSAGAGGSGPAGGGHSFVLLEETGGHVDPSIGYTTSGPGAAGQGDGERQQEQAPNLAPSFVDDQGNALAGLQLSTAEDTLLQGAFQARDPNGDSLTYSLARGPANGSLIVNADGTWQYLPNPDYNGADSFVVTVTDNRGASSSLTVDIGVSAVNDAPVARGSYGATLVDTAANDSFADIKGQLQASDVDGDQLTWSGSAKGAFGQLTVNPDGSYVYVVDAAAVNALPAGQHPQDSFTVTVRDPSGASDTRVIDIDIQGANDTPQASNAQAQATEDGQLTGQIAASDPDTGSSLTFTVDGKAPAGFTLQPDGNWSFDGKDPAYQHLGEGQTQVIVVPVVVTDDQGASSSSTLTITVTGTNDAPVAQAGSATTAENDVLNGQVPAASDVDGSIAGYQLASGVGTGNGTLTFNSDGSYSFDPGQDFDSLPAGVSRDVTFTYQAKDDSGALSAPQTITITVTGSNDAPVAQAATAAVNEDSQINGQLQASDADQGAQLQFGSDSPLPAGFTLGQDGKWSFDASDAAYQHLAAGQTQVISIPYLVTDDQGAVAGNTLTITVTGTNDVPVAQAASAAADEDQVSTGQLTATDADDGAVLTFGVDGNAPAGFTLKADGSWTFDGKDPAYQHLANGETQVISIPVIVTDDQGANTTSTLTLTITGTNDAPVAQADSATTGENGVLNGQVPAASDVDGSIVGYQLTNDVGAGNGTLTFNPDGSYRFDPGQDFDSLPAGVSRDVTFTYQAKDDSGALSDPQTITITVTGSNDVPVAQAASAAINEDSQISGQLQASDADQGEQLQFGSDNPLPAGFTLDQDGKWSFDASDAAYQHLAAGQTQVISIPYLVTDDQGAVAGNTLTITVTGTNDAPIAQASSAAADEDQVSTGQLTATDADDGAVLTFSIDGNAPAGFTLKTDGSWTFDGKDSAYQYLADGETQVISIPVIVTDEHGATSSSTLSITVTGTNDAPVAQAGSATTAENDVLNGQVPAATDVDGTIAGYQLASDVGTGNGTLTFNPDGSYTFDPGQDFDSLPAGVSRDVTFTYQAKDDSGALSDPQTITITVTGSNDAPVAQAATAAVDEDNQISGQLQASDADQGAQLQFGSDSPLPAGFTLGQDGKWSFDASDAAYQHLAAGQTQVISIPVVVTDDQGATSGSTLTITVTGTNDIPVAQAASAAADEDQVGTGQLVATDADDGAVLTFSIDGNAPAGFTLKTDGSWTFDGKDPAYQHLADGETQVISIPVIVTDDQGATNTSTLTLTITGTNDAPVALAGSATTAENDVLNGQVPAASDVDGTIAGYQLASGVGTGNGTLTFNSDGSYRFDPGQDFDSLPAGVSRDITFTYQAQDDSGALSAPQTITITVTGTNDAPVAQAATAAVNEDSQINGQLQATDADQGAQLQFGSDSPLPAGFTLDQDGKWTFDASDAAYQHLAAGQTQVISIPVVVTDDQGATSGSTLTITVTGTNDAPVAQAASAEVDEDQVSTGQLVATDADDGAVLTFSINGNTPAGLTLKTDGSWTFDGKDPAYQHLADGETQVISVPVVVTDDQGATSSSTLTITVTGTNDTPVAQAANAAVDEDQVSTGQLVATDADDGAVLTFSIDGNAPAGFTLKTDGSWTFDGKDSAYQHLAEGQTQVISIPVIVTDEHGATNSSSLTLTITGTNDAPVAQAGSATTEENTILNGQVPAASDVDGTIASYQLTTDVGAGNGTLTFNPNGSYSFDPGQDFDSLPAGVSRDITFTYQAKDDSGALSDPQTITITVTGTNDAPVAQAGSATTEENTILNGQVPAASDVDGTIAGYQLANGVGTGNGTLTFNPNGGYSFDPGHDFDSLPAGVSRDVTFTYQAKDDSGALSDPQTITITVTGSNDAPVAQAGSATTEENTILNGQVPAASDVDGIIAGYQLASGVGTGNGTLTFNSNGGYTFDPGHDFDSLPAGVSRDVTFTYQAKDDNGALSDPQTITITVTGTNDAPVAQAATAAVNEDSQINGQLQATDADQGAQLQFGSDSPLPAGFTLDQDGKWTFDASNPAYQHLAEGQTQVISIPVVVTDDQGATSGSTLTITVTGTNDAPVAQAASAAADEDQVSTGQLTATDADDGAVLTFSIDGNAPAGFTLQSDGRWTFDGKDLAYQHLANDETQVISIPVIVTDDQGATSSSTLTLTITGTNDAPVAQAGSATTGENTVLNGQVPAASDVDGTIAGYQLTTDVGTGNGTLTFNPNGSYTFDPGQDFDGLPAGVSRDVTFTYQAKDDSGALSAPQTITITVTGTNDAPVAQAGSATTEENTILDGQVPAASDVDGTIASYQLTTDVGTGNGTLTFHGDGSYTFDPSHDFDSLPAGVSRDVTFTYQAQDDSGALSAPQTITITVTGSNDAAVITGAQVSINETNAPITTGGQLTITDVDSPATFIEQTNVAGQYGHFNLAADGTWSYTADSAYNQLSVGQSLTDTFTVTSADGTTSSVSVTIDGTNDAAVITGAQVHINETNAPISTGGQLTITDVDSPATFVEQTNVAGQYGHFNLAADGTWSYTADSAYNQLNVGQSLTDTFTVTSADGTTSSVSVTIDGTNDAAVITGAQVSINETNAPISTGGQLTVTDVDSPATFVEQTNVAGQYGHFSLAADGTWSYTADSAYNELKLNETLTDTFNVQSADGTQSSVTVNIVGSNDAPVAQAASASAVEGGSLQPGVVAGATDGSALTLTITTTQPGEAISFNWTFTTQDYAPYNDFAFVQVNGQVVTLLSSVAAVGDYGTSGPQTFSHTFDQPGTYTLVIGVADSGDSSVDSTLVLSNLPPQASVVGSVGQAVQDGTGWTLTSNGANNQALVDQLKPVSEITGQLQASDVDHGAQLSYSVDGAAPAGFTLHSDGSWVFDAKDAAYDSLAANQVKVLQIGFTVTDEHGATGSSTLTLTITGTNDAPVANADQALTPINVALPSIDVLGNDSDVDGDALSVTKAVLADPSQGSVSINPDGTLNFVPAENVSGSVVIHYEISDSHGASASSSLTVQVGGNTPPQGADGSASLDEDSSHSFSAADFAFNDADAGQHLQAVRIDSLPGAGSLTFDGVAVVPGQVIAAADLGKLKFTPAANDNGAPYASFGFSVQDSAGAFDSASHTFTLDVTPVDDPSVLLPNVASMDEDDGSATGNVLDNDSDVDNTLSVSSYSVAGFSGNIAAGTGTTIVGVGSIVIDANGHYSFTPDANYHGAVPQITYTTNTGASSTLDITVNSANDLPVAENANKTTLEDTPVSGQVVASDVDGDALTYTLKPGSGPVNGTLVLDSSNGKYTYTPDHDYNGNDSFTVVVGDGQGGTVESVVNITVTAVNDEPVTADNSNTTAEDTAVSGQVVASDVDKDPLTYTLKPGSEPQHGTLVLDSSNGKYTYTPDHDYNGNDSFTVVVSDGQGGTVESVVSITVTAVNDAPIAHDDSATIDEDHSVTIDVLANDTDIDSSSLSVTGASASHGSVTINQDGTLTYTPDANYGGSDTIVYTISDGDGGTSSASVTVGITPVADAPLLSLDASSGHPASTGLTVQTWTGLALGSNGNGINPDTLQSVIDAAGAPASTSSTNSVSNGSVSAGTATKVSGLIFLEAGHTYTFAGVGDDSIRLVVGGTKVAEATWSGSSGKFSGTFTPSESGYYTLALYQHNQSGPGNYSLTLSDNGSPAQTLGTGSALLYHDGSELTAAGERLADLAGSNGQGYYQVYGLNEGREDSSIPLSKVNAALVDTDGSETLKVSIGSIPLGAVLSDGTLSFTAGAGKTSVDVTGWDLGKLTITPPQDFNGSFQLQVSATASETANGDLATSSQTLTVQVHPVNDAPVFTSAASQSTVEDSVLHGQLGASDIDGDNLTYALKNGGNPAHGSVVVNGDGSYSYTPAADYNGPDSFVVTVSDGHGGEAEQLVSVTVTPANDAPVFTSPASQSIAEDDVLHGQLAASDVDGDALTYALKNGSAPAHGSVVVNGDGSYSYTPLANYNGTDSFTVTVSDGQGGVTEQLVTVTVTPVNDAPVAASDSKTTGENSVLSDQVPAASDIDSPVNPNGYALVSGLGTGNGNLTFNANGSYVFNPGSDFDSLAPGESRQVSFTYTAKDSAGTTSAPATVTITVTGANDAPTGSDGTITLNEDSSRSFSALDFGFNDVDHNDALGAVRIDSLPGAGSLTFNGVAVTQGQVIAAADLGKLAFTPAANANGNNYASFTFSVKDSNGAFDSTPNKLTVNVTPVNDDPVAVNDHYLVGGLQGNYWGYRENTDGNNLTNLSMVSAFIAKTAPGATFTATALNYGNGVSTDLGGDKQLQKFLGSDAASLSTDPANTSDAIVQLTGLVNLAAGNYTFRVTADDGFSIRIDGVEVFKYDANQSPTARVSDSFNIAQGGNHQIEILYWDQGGNAQLKVELAPAGGSYSVLGGSSLSHPLAELVTNEDTALTIAANTLLGNDSDIDGDSLSILSVQGAVNGTVKLENGNVVFTPAKDVNGTGSFTYTVSDGHGGTSTATVTVGINAVNDAPVAKPDIASTQEDKPVTLNVLANDSDVDGDSLSVTSASASNGSVTVNADGTLTYTPKANFSGSDSITYTISDGHGGTASSTVALSVTPVADVPLLNSGSIFALNPGATSITTNQAITQANLETETGLSSGALDGINPPAGTTTSDQGNVDVIDGSLTSSDYTLKAGTQVNFAWTFTNGENSTSEINNGFNDIVALVVTGPDGVRQLIQVTSSEQRGASVNGSGVQNYTASSSGNYHFDWLVLNGGDANKDSSLNLDAPTFTLGGKTYGAPINVGINAALSDTDGSESLSVKITGMPNDATFTSGTHNADGSWSFTQAQLHDLQLLPASGYNGTLTLGVTAIATESDGSTASATQTLSITVASTNSSGNDLLHGYGTNSSNSTTDTLNGGDGHDILYGGAGNSILNGGTGNDSLYGGLGNDTLDGGKDNDLLVGGKGDDTLTGGDGADTFIWRAGDTGKDTITDFKPTDGDRIDLVDLLPDAAHNDILSYLKVDTATSTLQISTTGQVNSSPDVTIKLTGVDLKTYGATSADIVKSLVAGADPLVKTEHH
ncbi:retention module-containing protein [Pseudomonas citronellolis]|uniref:retention module-containing protein n=1 Tax=Pseudomonas citronellolis TaxID=53408 RepID=UPI0022BA1C09|nr:retention module-containing protein [Pseudomonas citronellolis]WBG61713.1 retention module-containing protein [Pseudomonas citronellolis]